MTGGAVGRAWGRLSLRARLLFIGVLGVAGALAIGSVALYGVLTVAGYRTIDRSGVATAAEVANLVGQGRLPDPIPVTGSQAVQVVDDHDRVVSASANGDRLTSMLTPREVAQVRAGSQVEVPGSRIGTDAPLRVVGVPARTSSGTATVLVAQQLRELEHSQQVLGLTLLITYPLLLAVLALIAWRVVGAALKPVENLRSTAERISGSDRDDRLPVPSSGDEIHALAVTLNSMLERLEASRARQRSFVADAAHELRSPLASMQTQLEVAHQLGEDTPVSEGLRAEVTRMTALVENLLLLARLDADRAPATPVEPIGLPELLADVAGDGRRVPVAVRPDAQVGGLVVLGHRDELRRAVANLVDNAARHARSAVEVTAFAKDGAVVVEVADDGHGVPVADRERIFERFTRLDEARDRDSGGSGLGLSIVSGVVARAGGTIWLDDAPLGGLLVSIALPAASGSG